MLSAQFLLVELSKLTFFFLLSSELAILSYRSLDAYPELQGHEDIKASIRAVARVSVYFEIPVTRQERGGCVSKLYTTDAPPELNGRS